MLGFYDCPPHPFEALDFEYEQKWIRIADTEAKELETLLYRAEGLCPLDLSTYIARPGKGRYG